MGYYWSKKEVDDKLKTIMVNAFNDVYEVSKKYSVDMRTGAYITSINRIVDVMKITWLDLTIKPGLNLKLVKTFYVREN